MRSYYGNLIVDILDLVFSFVSLVLVWVSCVKDSTIFFGISTAIYLLPRLLSVLLEIATNGRDVIRLVIDIVSLLMLLASFALVVITIFDFFVGTLNITDIDFRIMSKLFYIFSAISLSNIVYKVLVGILQRISLTIRNNKPTLNRR